MKFSIFRGEVGHMGRKWLRELVMQLSQAIITNFMSLAANIANTESTHLIKFKNSTFFQINGAS